MGKDQDMRNLPGLYLHLEAGHGPREVKVLSPLIPFVCPRSSWEELSSQANVSVSSVRADRDFHPLSAADSQTRMAVVPSPQMRQLKHQVERRRVPLRPGLNPAPALPHFPRSQGRGDSPADLAVLPSTRQLSALGRGCMLVWRELWPTGGGKGWQEQQDPLAGLLGAGRDDSL